MKSHMSLALGLALAAGMAAGCSGSGNDSPPVVSSEPTAAATDDRNVPQSDALTPAEAGLVSQANAEPNPAQKPDS